AVRRTGCDVYEERFVQDSGTDPGGHGGEAAVLLRKQARVHESRLPERSRSASDGGSRGNAEVTAFEDGAWAGPGRIRRMAAVGIEAEVARVEREAGTASPRDFDFLGDARRPPQSRQDHHRVRRDPAKDL